MSRGLTAVTVDNQASQACAKEEAVPKHASDLTPAMVVRWAVKSLYVDEALPRGPLLQWFLQLLLGVKFNHKELRAFIDSAPGMYAEPPMSKKLNFCAVLEGTHWPPGFKGFVSEEDVIETLSPEAWQEAAMYLAEGGWPKADDPSHKYYVVASWLQDVSPCLRGLSFGRVLSVVRCSAQSMGMLGHRGGLLVPYAHSEECERRVNACTGQPTHVAPDEQYVKTWHELKDCLRQLLREQKDEIIEVSKVKARFRTSFSMELSETVFGYQCLSKLLGDPQLTEEFVLETIQGNRYMLRLRSSPYSGPKVISLALATAADPVAWPDAQSAEEWREGGMA